MEEENIVTLDTLNEEVTETVESLTEKNKQLYARAKKAEGFTLEDGKWIKKPKELKEIPKEKESTQNVDELVDARLNTKLEERDLRSMPYPDTLKDKIKRVAKVDGKSVNEVVNNDPYLKFEIESWKKEQGIDDASIERKNRAGTQNGGDIDVSTDEGQKAWESEKEKMRKDPRYA